MKIVIEAEYPQINDALDFLKSITQYASNVLKQTPKDTVQAICMEKEGITIKITNV